MLRAVHAVLLCLILSACSTLPPGHNYPKVKSTALPGSVNTKLADRLAAATNKNAGMSGFRLLSYGVDGYLTRMQIIAAAERTLDLQYFIFRGDDSGRLMADAALRAADRGVRVRILIDDGETIAGDEQIMPLTSHQKIEIRTYNPFAYRGNSLTLKAFEYVLNRSRLNYRMHNKLIVADNAVAMLGGRNIGDQYVQIDPEEQYADNDIFAVGPIVEHLSASFDEFWNHPLSIPIEALSPDAWHTALHERRKLTETAPAEVKSDRVDLFERVNSGEPFNGMIDGSLPLVWAQARVISDSPDKKKVVDGSIAGRLMHKSVAAASRAVQSELLMITAYLIPGEEGMQLFNDLRRRNVQVRILTNSLQSSTVVLAHSGYIGYRVPLLKDGVELYETRARLGNNRGSGQTAEMSRHGTYSLHAKMFVFDRRQVFVGSMNFDQRSMHLNTEVGLLIDSPELAEQLAQRFAAMAQPANAYQVLLQADTEGSASHLIWRTLEEGQPVDLQEEPARSETQRLKVKALSLLPLDAEL